MTSVNFLGQFPIWLSLLVAIAAGAACWKLYSLESAKVGWPYSFLLPLLRSAAVALVILILSGPTLHRRSIHGEPAELTFLIDASRSMSLSDRGYSEPLKQQIAQALQWQSASVASAHLVERSSRYERAVRLLKSSTLLDDLSKQFNLSVARFSDSEPIILVQSTAVDPHIDLSSSDAWNAELGEATAIGDALSNQNSRTSTHAEAAGTESQPTSSAKEGPKSLVVLLSDGRNNSGSTISAQIARMKGSATSVIAVGYGSEIDQDDLAVVDIEYPKQIFFRDRLRGSVFVKEKSSQPREYQIVIAHDGQPLWQHTLQSQNSDRRRVDYSFPIEKLVESIRAGRPTDERHAVVPIQLEVSLSELPLEADLGNNRQSFRLAASTHTSSVLILDGRARWETRYIKNLFDRDPNWKVNMVRLDKNIVVADPVADSQPSTLAAGIRGQRFPATKSELMDYDLIVLGEVEPGILTEIEFNWIAEFVEHSGGGLILIDGDFGLLHQDHCRPLQPLMSLQPKQETLTGGLHRVRPQTNSTQAAILQLTDQPSASLLAWNDLQPIRIKPMELKPGGEVLLETNNEPSLPVLALRQFGAGRVAHFATDETWRWRFKVADQIHGRFWNQIATAVMRLPFAVENSLAAIDSGRIEYKAAELIEIRCRLRQPDGMAASPLRVEAVISGGASQLIATMTPHPHIPGIYTTTAGPLPAGEYTVKIRATDFSADSLDLETRFHVTSDRSLEMTDVTCDVAALQDLAEQTGGTYLHESEVERLESLIQPFQAGKISESDIILWQSYWWFTPIVLLLIAEWILRKRSGLI